jgi:hypothetical protein
MYTGSQTHRSSLVTAARWESRLRSCHHDNLSYVIVTTIVRTKSNISLLVRTFLIKLKRSSRFFLTNRSSIEPIWSGIIFLCSWNETAMLSWGLYKFIAKLKDLTFGLALTSQPAPYRAQRDPTTLQSGHTQRCSSIGHRSMQILIWNAIIRTKRQSHWLPLVW